MNKLIFITLIIFSVSSLASQSPDCYKIKENRLRLAVAAQNIGYAEVTRTTEGGFYKPILVKSCNRGVCKLTKDEVPLLAYLPDHPDADAHGYVKLPNVNLKNELANLNILAIKLKLYGKSGACGSKLIGAGNAILIKYFGSDSVSDVFNFDKDGQLISWARGDGGGKSATINFDSKGGLRAYNSETML